MLLDSVAACTFTARGGGVLVVGSANVDLIAYSPRLPVSGETLAGLSFEQSPGGKGANQAVAAAKLGSNVRFVTQLGEDSMGEESLANYRAVGIDTTHIFTTSEARTGVALITVNAGSGDNTIVVCAGAAALLNEAQLDTAAEAFAQSSVLLTQLEVPLPTTLAALRRGREAGLLTVCNTAPAPEGGLPDELLSLCAAPPSARPLHALCTASAPSLPRPPAPFLSPLICSPRCLLSAPSLPPSLPPLCSPAGRTCSVPTRARRPC